MRHALWLIVLAIACDRSPPRDEAPAPSSPGAPAPAAPGCTIAPLPLRRPAPRRLVAIGDLHGDLAGARAALRAAGAIDDRDRWIGGELVVVQTGDVLDRGDDERALLDLLARLEAEARAAGGALVLLLGNHELMNAAGDFRYVTPAGFHAFDAVDAARRPGAVPLAGIPDQLRSRMAALGPGGSYARWLAQHAVVAIVGDTVFSHAGVLGGWTERVAAVNQATRCWLDGQVTEPSPALGSDDSPVWTRAAAMPSVDGRSPELGGGDGSAGGAGGKAPRGIDCTGVVAALAALGVKRMVVGHTVQDHGITSACDGTLWRIDVGLSRHYGGPIEVLELVPGVPPRVITGARSPG